MFSSEKLNRSKRSYRCTRAVTEDRNQNRPVLHDCACCVFRFLRWPCFFYRSISARGFTPYHFSVLSISNTSHCFLCVVACSLLVAMVGGGIQRTTWERWTGQGGRINYVVTARRAAGLLDRYEYYYIIVNTMGNFHREYTLI